MVEVNPWIPMKDPQDLKTMGKLLEELGELTAAASRCVIQGIDSSEPVTGKVNKIWLTEEVADALANIDLVVERFNLNRYSISDRVVHKKEKLRVWHKMEA